MGGGGGVEWTDGVGRVEIGFLFLFASAWI